MLIANSFQPINVVLLAQTFTGSLLTINCMAPIGWPPFIYVYVSFLVCIALSLPTMEMMVEQWALPTYPWVSEAPTRLKKTEDALLRYALNHIL